MFHSERTLGVQEEKANNLGATLKRLAAYFKPYWLVLLLVGVLTIAGTYMQVIVPDLTGQIVDCYLTPYVAGSTAAEAAGLSQLPDLPAGAEIGQESGAAHQLLVWRPRHRRHRRGNGRRTGRLMLIILALFIGSAAITAVSFYGLRWAGFRVLRDMRAEVFAHVQDLSLGLLHQARSRRRHEPLHQRHRTTCSRRSPSPCCRSLSGFLLIFMIIWQMFAKSAPYALISLITLPLMFIATRWFSGQARKAFRQAQTEIGAVNADLQESISAVREVQAFSREDENIEQFRLSNAANRDANIRAQAYTSALAPTLEAFGYVSLAIVAVVGGLMLLGGGTLAGHDHLLGPDHHFHRLHAAVQPPGAADIGPVDQLSRAPSPAPSAFLGCWTHRWRSQEKEDAVELPHVVGRVVYENVWAEYKPGEAVLKGIDIDAEPGKTIAIVGPTGAGKTTIINLLPRFWDVSSGRITIDGYDVRDVTLQSLREQIGIVLQDTLPFQRHRDQQHPLRPS